jgi:hypothetical protein
VSKCAEYPQLWRGSRVLHEVLLGLFQEHPGVGDLGEDRMIEYEPSGARRSRILYFGGTHLARLFRGMISVARLFHP